MDYAATKIQLIDYYKNLLIMQYHDKSNAQDEIQLAIETMLADMLIFKMKEAFDIDNETYCIGVQLDIIGKWVGVDRLFKGQKFDNQNWFALVDWDETADPVLQGGLQDWDEPTPADAGFLDYSWIISTKNSLSDDDFRMLIKLKIVKNNVSCTAKNIDDEIFKLFADGVYTVWGDVMELNYYYNSANRSIIKLAEEKNALPAPTAVTVNLLEI